MFDRRYTENLLGHKGAVIGFWCVVTLCLFFGVRGLSLDATYTAYFDPGDPLLPIVERLRERYGQYDSVVAILHKEQGTWLDDGAKTEVIHISEALAELPQVARIDDYTESLSMYENPELRPFPEAEISETGNVWLENELLLSGDRKYTAVVISFYPQEETTPRNTLDQLQTIRDVVSSIANASDRSFNSYYTGTLSLNEAYITVVRHDLRLFFPAALIAFTICLGALFRNYIIALQILCVAIIAAASAFGIAGWLLIPLASIHSFVPIIIMTLSIAGSVHLVTCYADGIIDSGNQLEAIYHSIRINRLPLTLTCGSTALGFLALTLSPSPPVQRVGQIVALGVGLSWMLNLSLLPVLLGSNRPNRYIQRHGFGIGRVVRFCIRRRNSISILMVVALGLAIIGVSQSQINDNVFDYFDETVPFSIATDIANQEFYGVNEVAYELSVLEAQNVFDLRYQEILSGFTTWLSDQPEVRHVVGFANKTKFANEFTLSRFGTGLEFQDGWYENAPKHLRQFISRDLKSTRIVVYLKELDADAIIGFDHRAKSWLESNSESLSFAGGSGASLMFAHLGKRNASNMMLSFSFALIGISLVIGLISRSWRILIAALVCNVLPVSAVYAMWSLGGGYISLGGAIVMGMILGIVVDDTFFIVNRYSDLKSKGEPFAVQLALERVGPALVITTITLCVGLSIGLFSNFTPIYTMSLLSTSIIALALVCDIVFLPPLLYSNRFREPDNKVSD